MKNLRWWHLHKKLRASDWKVFSKFAYPRLIFTLKFGSNTSRFARAYPKINVFIKFWNFMKIFSKNFFGWIFFLDFYWNWFLEPNSKSSLISWNSKRKLISDIYLSCVSKFDEFDPVWFLRKIERVQSFEAILPLSCKSSSSRKAVP